MLPAIFGTALKMKAAGSSKVLVHFHEATVFHSRIQ
jgi:hypothetical protein